MTLEATNGAPFSVADRTQPMFPHLADRSDPMPLDVDVPAAVRKLLLATVGLTREQIQDELGDPRVPLGVIAAALDQLGATVAADQRWILRSAEDAEATMKRRADVLVALHDFDEPATASHIWDEDAGEPYDDLVAVFDGLVVAGVVEVSGADPTYYALSHDVYDRIIRLGAEAVARSTMPELATPADRTEYERVATERFEAERKATFVAQGERDRLAAWLREKGQDPGEILNPAEPVAPGPKRDVFLWTKIVTVDDAMELEIAREERKLRAELEMSQALLDMEAGRHKGVKERVNGKLKEFAQAVADKSYHRCIEAFRVPLWEEDVTLVIKAIDGTTILDREPIAKGTQRSLPVDVSPKAASVPPVDWANQAAVDADAATAARAETIKGTGPKGEMTMERMTAEAESLLRKFGKTGLEWGDNGDAAVNSLARCAHNRESGRLPVEVKRLARVALNRLLADGRAIRIDDAVVWSGVTIGCGEASA